MPKEKREKNKHMKLNCENFSGFRKVIRMVESLTFDFQRTQATKKLCDSLCLFVDSEQRVWTSQLWLF